MKKSNVKISEKLKNLINKKQNTSKNNVADSTFESAILTNENTAETTNQEEINEVIEEQADEVQEVEKPVIPDSDDEIISRNCKVVEEIIADYDNRLLGSKNERATANLLLTKIEEILGVKSALEPFYVHKNAHKLAFITFGVFLLLSLITFAISPITSLIIYLITMFLLVGRVVFKRDIKLPKDKQVSFNVVSELKSEKPKNTLILLSNYSTCQNQNINRFFKVNTRALLISFSLIILLTFILLVVLSTGIVNIGLQVVVGLLISTLMLICFSWYGFDKKQNKNVKNGLEGVGVTMMLADYLNQHPEVLGDNTKVVLSVLGGGVDNYNGTKAFIKQHFKNNNDYENAIVLSINCPCPNKLTLLSKKGSKSSVTNKVYEKLANEGAIKEIGVIKGTEASLFNSIGVSVASIGESQIVMDTNFNTLNDDKFDIDKVKNSFYKYLDIVKSLLNSLNKDN